jgi:delta-1-pyrroline-5-carboxylate synthetase
MDSDADVAKSIRVIVDAKTDYPAACNALETLLVHRDWVGTQTLTDIINALKDAGVSGLAWLDRFGTR